MELEINIDGRAPTARYACVCGLENMPYNERMSNWNDINGMIKGMVLQVMIIFGEQIVNSDVKKHFTQ